MQQGGETDAYAQMMTVNVTSLVITRLISKFAKATTELDKWKSCAGCVDKYVVSLL